jgi:hypothetical protein
MAKLIFSIDEKELDKEIAKLIQGRIVHFMRNGEDIKELIRNVADTEIKKQVNKVFLLDIDVKSMAIRKIDNKINGLIQAAVTKLREDITFITGAAIEKRNVKVIEKMFTSTKRR